MAPGDKPTGATKAKISKAHDLYQRQCIFLLKPIHDEHHSDVTSSGCPWCLVRDGKISSPFQVRTPIPGRISEREQNRPSIHSVGSAEQELSATPSEGTDTRATTEYAYGRDDAVNDGDEAKETYTIKKLATGSGFEITAPRSVMPRSVFMRDGNVFKDSISFDYEEEENLL